MIFSKIVISFIRLYQRTISPDRGVLRAIFGGPRCVMYPSCSEYTLISIEKFGLVHGLMRGARRVISCNPFQKKLIDIP